MNRVLIEDYGDVDGDGTTTGVDEDGFGLDCVVLQPVAAIEMAAIAAASVLRNRNLSTELFLSASSRRRRTRAVSRRVPRSRVSTPEEETAAYR